MGASPTRPRKISAEPRGLINGRSALKPSAKYFQISHIGSRGRSLSSWDARGDCTWGVVGGVTMDSICSLCCRRWFGSGQGERDGDRSAEARTGARGSGVAAVLAGDVADQEETEAGALDLRHGAAWDTVEAVEDALELI